MVNSRTRVVIGMSGGVDSSAAAALLQAEGYEVIGVTLKLWPQDCLSRAEDKCCGPQAVMDARSVCHDLGIPYYLIDEAEEFQNSVINYFSSEYKAGRTPNPCVICNEKLKFGRLLTRARQLGAHYVATGHFARIEPCETGARYLLKRGHDLRKDQSYFLFSLTQEQLRHALMPLGALTKTDTRNIARAQHLKTAEKEESMEICFVPDNDYGNFLRQTGDAAIPGDIVNQRGEVLGRHEGIQFFTIGQRKGLRLNTSLPLYVTALDPATNRVVVGEPSDLDEREFFLERCNWISFETPPVELQAMAKIRYNHPGVPAEIFPDSNGGARVILSEDQRAITPGQACVFYEGEMVLGGGWISRSTPSATPGGTLGRG